MDIKANINQLIHYNCVLCEQIDDLVILLRTHKTIYQTSKKLHPHISAIWEMKQKIVSEIVKFK